MKRLLVPWSLLAAALIAAATSCMYEPLRLEPIPRLWKSTGIVVRAEVPDAAAGSLRVSWSGTLAVPTAVPEEKPAPLERPPGGAWTENLPRADAVFSNLAAGDTADLYREPAEVVGDTGSILRPGDWDFSFSIWEDGCPATAMCRQEIYGRLDSPYQEEPVTQTAELAVSRYGCSAPAGGLKTASVNRSPVLANNAAIAPIGDYRTGAPPCRWAELWGAANEWTVAADNATGKKGMMLASASADRRLLAWDYVPPAETVEILAKVRPGADRGAAVCGRAAGVSGAGADNAFCAGLVDGTDLQVGRLVGGAASVLDTRAFAYGNGDYWIRFRIEGNTVRAKVWVDNTLDPNLANEPGWMIDNTVPAGPPPAPGLAGIAAGSASGGPRLEWFSVGLRGASAPGPAASMIRAPAPPAPRPAGRPRALPRRPAPAR